MTERRNCRSDTKTVILSRSFGLKLLVFYAFIFLVSGLPGHLFAQQGNDYIRGQQLMQNNKYEEAFEIFSRLYRQNPENYPVFDNAITCLVQLKRYDEAISLLRNRIGRNWQDIVSVTKLAEVYHIAGDTTSAYDAWNRTLSANANQLNTYRYIAENMNSRREYGKANELYLQARNRFGVKTLFILEMANNNMRLGKPEMAASEFVTYLEENPQTLGVIQRQLHLYDDRYLYNSIILELEDRAGNLRPASLAYQTNRDLLINILIQQSFYRRALSAARQYEQMVPEGSWPLLSVATRFRSVHEFELAEQALKHYTEQPKHILLSRSLEEMAILYVTWGKYLRFHNLDFEGKTDGYYQEASKFLSRLINDFPTYDRRREAVLLQAELALDHLKNSETATIYLGILRNMPQTNETRIYTEYLEGRIQMFEGNNTMARLHLTRSNRSARTGEMADRTRYFLAKNDFFTGDFDFARIQLRALERQSTSFYANDALQLRLWMQTGIVRDSISNEMRLFAKAVSHMESGWDDEAIKSFLEILKTNGDVPLKYESYILASGIIQRNHPKLSYYLLSHGVRAGQSSAMRERILWDYARVADGMDRFLNYGTTLKIEESLTPVANWLASDNKNLKDLLLLPDGQVRTDIPVQITREEVIRLYENILIEYPQGFYSQRVRDRLTELQQLPETI